ERLFRAHRRAVPTKRAPEKTPKAEEGLHDAARRGGGIERADIGQAPGGAPAGQVHDRHVVQGDVLQQLVRAKVEVQVFSRMDAHERRGLGGVYCRSYTATEL